MTETFKLVVAGCGRRARAQIAAARSLADEGVSVVGIIDREDERVRRVARELAVPAAFTSLLAAVDQTSPHGVIVALPRSRQTRATNLALALGTHVLCDAPFGNTPIEAAAMSRAWMRTDGQFLMAGSRYPLLPEWALDQISAGKIGPVRLVEGTWLRSTGDSDRRVGDRSIHGRLQWEGVLYEQAEHIVSVGLEMIKGIPKKVSAVGWVDHGSGEPDSDPRVEDMVHLVVDCHDGSRATFAALESPDLAADELRVRCLGKAGSLEVPLLVDELDDELDAEEFRPTLVVRGESTRGDLPLTPAQALAVQMLGWVRICRKDEGVPMARYGGTTLPETVHKVLRAGLRSMIKRGEQIEL